MSDPISKETLAALRDAAETDGACILCDRTTRSARRCSEVCVPTVSVEVDELLSLLSRVEQADRLEADLRERDARIERLLAMHVRPRLQRRPIVTDSERFAALLNAYRSAVVDAHVTDMQAAVNREVDARDEVLKAWWALRDSCDEASAAIRHRDAWLKANGELLAALESERQEAARLRTEVERLTSERDYAAGFSPFRDTLGHGPDCSCNGCHS